MSKLDKQNLVQRLRIERSIDLDATLIDDGAEELTPEEEGNIIAEYGFDALVRYYCPQDPRLPALPQGVPEYPGGGT